MDTSKIKSLLICLVAFFLLNCRNNSTSKENKTLNTRAEAIVSDTSPNFDKILKCKAYSYDEGYFLTADAGCLYQPKGDNTFGNLITYLIPKKTLNISDDNIEMETNRVNSLTVAQFKEDFDIYVYVIDKKYLNYNQTGDPVYYQKEDFAEQLYTYDNQSQKWKLVDYVSITSADHAKEQNWKDGFISKQISKSVVKTD